MSACRAIIYDALGMLRTLAPGDDPNADEFAMCLGQLGQLIQDIHEARGPLLDIDVPGPDWVTDASSFIPSEEQRIRIQAGTTYTLVLPNSIPIYTAGDPYDYGFSPGVIPAPTGSLSPADGIQYRQPRDGTRIEVVGTVSALYFYRADINSWQPATGLTLDGESPLNPRYDSALGARLAERVAPRYPDFAPDPFFIKRLQRANVALLMRPGVSRDPVQPDYF